MKRARSRFISMLVIAVMASALLLGGCSSFFSEPQSEFEESEVTVLGSSQNLLPNPDFDNWEMKEGGFRYDGELVYTPVGWTLTLGGQEGVEKLDDEVHGQSTEEYLSAGKSVQTTIVDASLNKGFFTYVYDLSVEEEETYELSVWVKTEDLAASDAGYVRIFPKDSEGETVGDALTPIEISSGTADWTEYTGEVTIPQGAVTLDLGLSHFNAEGTIWWDDVGLVKEGLTGTVEYDDGVPVDGAAVELIDTDYSTQTEADGFFDLGVIPDGDYRLSVSVDGEARKTRDITVEDPMESQDLEILYPDPSNLLPNPGVNAWEMKEGEFRYDGELVDTPVGWTLTLGGADGVEKLPDEVHGPSTEEYVIGSYSVQSTIVDASQNKGFFTYAYDIPVEEEATYEVSAWVKTENLASSDAGYVRIFPLDSEGETVGDPLTPIEVDSGTADWTEYTGEITIPQGAVTLDLGLSHFNAEGTIWWDDVSLEYVDEAPEYPSDIQQLIDNPPGTNVINLGDHGLQDGDNINPYLETWVQNGNRVYIPEGTYYLTSQITLDASNASVIGEGEVIFDRGNQSTNRVLVRPGGDFDIRNITLIGTGADQHGGGFLPSTTNPNATVVLYNIKLPDGAVQGSSTGMMVSRHHAGELYLIDCLINGFADNGLYGSAPSLDGQGEVHVYGGIYQNNNIANIRIGSTNSSIRNAVSIQDDLAPAYTNGARNQRGIWTFGYGSNMLIQNTDVIQTIGWVPVALTRGSGTLNYVRIYTESSSVAININDGTNYGGSDIHISGTGNYTINGPHSFTNIYYGDDADKPPLAP